MEKLILLIVIVVGYKLYGLIKEERKLRYLNKINIDELKEMDPRDFEIFCARLFEKHGYKVTVTQATNDGGKDIILKNKLGTTYVECKRYDGSVGRPIANKLYGVMVADGVPNGMIITTGYYSKECLNFCSRVCISCYDLGDIAILMGKVSMHKISDCGAN